MACDQVQEPGFDNRHENLLFSGSDGVVDGRAGRFVLLHIEERKPWLASTSPNGLTRESITGLESAPCETLLAHV
jgi:hypothetical protein